MHIQDGTTLQEMYYIGMYYISTDWCTFMAFPHHLPDINLCGIISCSVMLSVCPVLPQSRAIPWEFEWNFIYVISIWILRIDGWGISCEIALIWMSLDFTDDQSTLVQVMAWCHQATSHFFKQCLPRSQCHMVSPGQNELIDVMALVLEDIRQNIIVFCNISWIWTEYEKKIKNMQFWCTKNYFHIIYSHLDNMMW